MLVGTFLQAWALMEAQMNHAIITALELGDVQGVMVVRNVQLRSKIHILKTAVNVTLPIDRREPYIDLLNQITTMSETDRNVVAHDLFGPDPDGDGVEFLVIKAKGKLKFPEVKWSINDCVEKINKMNFYRKQLEGLQQSFKNNSLINQLLAHDTSEHSDELARLGLLSRQPPESQNSDTDPSTPEKGE